MPEQSTMLPFEENTNYYTSEPLPLTVFANLAESPDLTPVANGKKETKEPTVHATDNNSVIQLDADAEG